MQHKLVTVEVFVLRITIARMVNLMDPMSRIVSDGILDEVDDLLWYNEERRSSFIGMTDASRCRKEGIILMTNLATDQ